MSSRICFIIVCFLSISLALQIPMGNGRKKAIFQKIKYDSNSEQSSGKPNNGSVLELIDPLKVPKNPLLVSQQLNGDANDTIFKRMKIVNFQQSKKLLPVVQQSNEPTNNSIFQRVKRDSLQKSGSFLSSFQHSNGHTDDITLQRLARKQLQKSNIPHLVSQQSNANTDNLILQRVKRDREYKFNVPANRRGVTQPQPFCTKFLCRRPSATKLPRYSTAQSQCAPGYRFDRNVKRCRKLT